MDYHTSKGAAILHNVIIAVLSLIALQVAIIAHYVNIAIGRKIYVVGFERWTLSFFAFVGSLKKSPEII